MEKFQGIYPALVTPFDQEGKLNIKILDSLLHHLMECGVDGFYVGGSTGESYLLSMEERKRLLEAVMETAGKKVKIIANIGLFATAHGIELAKHAEKLGVSAISSVPPFYFNFCMEEYLNYYEELANAVELPVIIYNIPAMSGVRFSKEDLYRLLSNEKIVGMKHTSYDLFQLQQVLQEFPEKSVFAGHDELFLSALSTGVRAGIGSTYNIMPKKFIELMRLFRERRMDEALRIQGEINDVISVLCQVGIFKGIKELLRLQGFDCGTCRKPFLPLAEEDKKRIAALYENYFV